MSPSAWVLVCSMASSARRTCSSSRPSMPARPAGLEHGHRDRVRDHVVQLPGDGGALLGDGPAGLLLLLAHEQGVGCAPGRLAGASPDPSPTGRRRRRRRTTTSPTLAVSPSVITKTAMPITTRTAARPDLAAAGVRAEGEDRDEEGDHERRGRCCRRPAPRWSAPRGRASVAMKAGTGWVRRQYSGTCQRRGRAARRPAGRRPRRRAARPTRPTRRDPGDDRVAVLPQPRPPGHPLTVGRGRRSPGHPRE